MKEKTRKIDVLSSEFKEVFSTMSSRPENKGFINFLKVQMNNIAVIEWFRVKSTDPDLGRRKAYFEGEYDILATIVRLLEEAGKEKE